MIAKREETLKFFRDMESNIKLKIERAKEEEARRLRQSGYSPDSRDNHVSFEDLDPRDIIYYHADSKDETSGRVRFASTEDTKDLLYGFEGRARLNSFGGPPRRVRTISTMDDEILMMTRQSSGEDRRTTMYALSKTQPIAVADEKSGSRSPHSPTAKDSKSSKDDTSTARKAASTGGNGLRRRNSTGTIYLTQTMATQDNNSTIHCVCMVIRAHMVQAARENIIPLPQYDVFIDAAFVGKKQTEARDVASALAMVPSLQTVKDFFTLIFNKSQLERDCIIMALIYCERLVKETRGRLCIRYDNWRSIVFACLVMASKVWDDLSMWNIDFSQVYPSFDLARVNALELAMLDALKYVIRVSASEYAKYYFHLRSLMVRLGLQKGDDANFIRPLDLAGARRLQLGTERYEESAQEPGPRRRHHSVHIDGDRMHALHLERNLTEHYDLSALRSPVGLEQLIHTEHMDADGTVHLKKKPSGRDLVRAEKK